MLYITEEIMVNRRLWLAAALVLGIVAAGCKQDVNYELPPAKGKITINNIPEEYNGKYVFFSGATELDKVVVCGFTEMHNIGKGEKESIKLATISDGTAEIPMYKINQKAESFSDYIEAYSGDGVFGGTIFIFDDVFVTWNDLFVTWEEVSKERKDPLITKPILDEPFSDDGNLTIEWTKGPPEEIIEEELTLL